jgi:hypothetical protein
VSTKFKARFYDEDTGDLLEEVVVKGSPIRAGERIPNVANVPLALVTRVEPEQPAPVGRGRSLIQKVWVRDWYKVK